MLKLRKRNKRNAPEMQISPMIDMIFLLLVFFIVSTMYMTQVKTVSLNLPKAENSALQKKVTFNVSVKADNSLWLEDNPITLNQLVEGAKLEQKKGQVAVVIRADAKASYGVVMQVLDKLKGVGITQFGMAAESEVKP